MQQTIRSLGKRKWWVLANITSLSIGVSSCLITFLIIYHELNFDIFFADRDRIFRIYTEDPANARFLSGAPTAVHSFIKANFTGIESSVNFHSWETTVTLKSGNILKRFSNYERVVITSADYFNVLNFYEWAVGDPSTALGNPHDLVLTESRARLYFGNVPLEKIIGQEVFYQDSLIMTVAGIVKDPAGRTDFTFTDFISDKTLSGTWLKDQIQLNSWGSVNSSSQLFVKISKGATHEDLSKQLESVTHNYFTKYKKNYSYVLRIQPLGDLHFNTSLGIFNHSRPPADVKTLWILFVTATIILLLAVVNYVTLSSAINSSRVKEVVIRKIFGISQTQLIRELLLENALLATIAVVSSIVITKIALTQWPEFLPDDFVPNFSDPNNIIFLASAVVLLTFAAGFYPAQILSGTPVTSSMGRAMNPSGRGGSASRPSRLVAPILQITVSQILTTCSLVATMQIHFMLNKDLGYSRESIVYLRAPSNTSPDAIQHFKNQVENLSTIESVAIGQPPNVSGPASTISYKTASEVITEIAINIPSDTSYLKLFGMKLIAGRNFHPSDSIKEYVVTASLAKKFGCASPDEIVGKFVDNNSLVVGVVNDFHSKSLHSPIRPVVLYYGRNSWMCIRLAKSSANFSGLRESLSGIEKAWKNSFSDELFTVTFLDDALSRQYDADQRTARLSFIAAVVAFMIACIGLLSMTTLSIVRRTREIGVRKILGATRNNLLVLLTRDLIKVSFFSAFFAVPASALIAFDWLSHFTYRAEISVLLYCGTTIITFLSGLAITSFQTIRATSVDPAQLLRQE